jgi:hypothetical protein
VEYHFEDEKRFVRVRFTGLWPISEVSPALPKILEECRARKQDLLFIDFSGVENKKVSLAERFRLGKSALGFAGKLRRIVVLGRADLIDRQKFGEMVARNRGINIRVFLTVDEATQWLLAEDPPARPGGS